jgi:AcrR family transcriptional regulator
MDSPTPLEEAGSGAVNTARAILDAGEFLFQRQGFHGTSMRQLARFAGVTPAAIYNHFPSKEEIFIALLRARLPSRALALAVQEAQGDSPAALLGDGLRRMRQAMVDRLENLRLIMVEILEFEGRHLPLVLPEIVAPAFSFIDRVRSSDPRLTDWPAPFLMRLIGGSFIIFAASEPYLAQAGALAPDPADYERLASILAAGLLGGHVRQASVEEGQ